MCILTVKLSVLTHRTDGIVLLIKCMLLNALKKLGMQNYEGRKAGVAEVCGSVTCE